MHASLQHACYIGRGSLLSIIQRSWKLPRLGRVMAGHIHCFGESYSYQLQPAWS